MTSKNTKLLIKMNLNKNYVPIEYPKFKKFMEFIPEIRSYPTFVPSKKLPVYDWFSYAQGFSKQLVEYCISRFSIKPKKIFDPFCGVSTTQLACLDNNVNSFGCDISPLSIFVSNVKLNWPYDITSIRKNFSKILKNKIPTKKIDLINNQLFERAFSKKNLIDMFSIRESIYNIEIRQNRDLLLLGLISSLEESSNIRKHGAHYRFINNNNIGVKLQFNEPPKLLDVFKIKIEKFIEDIIFRQKNFPNNNDKKARALLGDARKLRNYPKFDAVITSPPYLNRDNYIAQSKLELFLLQLVKSFDEYRKLTSNTLRSHVEATNEYNENYFPKDLRILCEKIEEMNPSYKSVPEMVKGYFQDMHLVFSELKQRIRKNGEMAIVVGNVRWAGIVIPVDTMLMKISEELGFTPRKIVISRYKNNSPQQMLKYGKIPVRESILFIGNNK